MNSTDNISELDGFWMELVLMCIIPSINHRCQWMLFEWVLIEHFQYWFCLWQLNCRRPCVHSAWTFWLVNWKRGFRLPCLCVCQWRPQSTTDLTSIKDHFIDRFNSSEAFHQLRPIQYSSIEFVHLIPSNQSIQSCLIRPLN